MTDRVSFEIEKGARMLVTSDIHGWPDLLVRLLKKAEYRPGRDWLFILGDTVEKGPDSIGAMKLVYRLSRSDRVCVLRGNVDRWLGRLFSGDPEKALSYDAFRPENTLSQAARELGFGKVNAENLEAVRSAFLSVYGEEVAFFAQAPVCAVTDGYVMTHSGLPADGTLNGPAEDFTSNYKFFRTRRNNTGKTVIHGHIPTYYLNEDTSYSPHFDDENKVISIDGGTVTYSLQVNMLIIEDGRIDWIAEDALPKAEVTEDVAGDMSGLVKIYPDYDEKRDNTKVEILEKGRYFSRVRCLTTGQTGLAKNEMILPGGICYGELSAFLPAKKGDRVGLAFGATEGYSYVKDAHGRMGFLPNGALKK